jgi:hypothetical protein
MTNPDVDIPILVLLSHLSPQVSPLESPKKLLCLLWCV